MAKNFYFQLYDILDGYKLTSTRQLKKNINKLNDRDCKDLGDQWKEVYKSLDYESIRAKFNEANILRYFPSSRFQHELTEDDINRFLLYADQLVLYDPLVILGIATSSKIGLEGSLETKLPQFLSYKPLFEDKIGIMIPDASIYRTYNSKSLIGQIIEDDVNDSEFSKLCQGNIVLGKTDEGHEISVFDNEYQIHLDQIQINQDGPKEVSASIPTKIASTMKVDRNALKTKQERIDGLVTNKAMEINFDLYFNHNFNSQLISNRNLTTMLLKNKAKRIASIEKKVDMKYLPSLLTLDLPNFKKVKTKKLVKFRHKYSNEFENFKLEIKKSFKEIQTIPFSTQFKDDVSNIQEEKIDPALLNLNQEIKFLKRDKLRRILGNAAITSAPLVGSFMLNDIYQIFAIAGATFMGGNTLKESISLAFDYMKEKDLKRLNSWYFLWRTTK